MSDTWKSLVSDLRALVAAEVRRAQASPRLERAEDLEDIGRWVKAARSAVGGWATRAEALNQPATRIPFADSEFANVIRGCSWDSAIPLLTTFSLLSNVPYWSLLRWEQLDSPILPVPFVQKAILGRSTSLGSGETGFAALAALRGNCEDGILIGDGFADLRRAHSLVDQIAGLRNNLFIPIYSRGQQRLILAVVVISLPIPNVLPQSLVQTAARLCERNSELYHVQYREGLSDERIELSKRFQSQPPEHTLSARVVGALTDSITTKETVNSAIVPVAASFTVRRNKEERSPRISKSTCVVSREHYARVSAERAELRFFNGQSSFSAAESWTLLASEGTTGLRLWAHGPSAEEIQLPEADELLRWLSYVYDASTVNRRQPNDLYFAIDVVREVGSQALEYVILGKSQERERCLLSYEFSKAFYREGQTRFRGDPEQILESLVSQWNEQVTIHSGVDALALTLYERGTGWDAGGVLPSSSHAYVKRFRQAFKVDANSKQRAAWERRLRAEFCGNDPLLAWARALTAWTTAVLHNHEKVVSSARKELDFDPCNFSSLLLEGANALHVSVQGDEVTVEISGAEKSKVIGQFVRWPNADWPLAWTGVKSRVIIDNRPSQIPQVTMPSVPIALLENQSHKVLGDGTLQREFDLPGDGPSDNWQPVSPVQQKWLVQLLTERAPTMLSDVDVIVFAAFCPGAPDGQKLSLSSLYRGTQDAVLMAVGALLDVQTAVDEGEGPRTILADRLKHLLAIVQKDVEVLYLRETGGAEDGILSDLLHDFKEKAVRSLGEIIGTLDQDQIDASVPLMVEALLTYFLLRAGGTKEMNKVDITGGVLVRWFREARPQSELRLHSKGRSSQDVECIIESVADTEAVALPNPVETLGRRFAANLLANALAAAVDAPKDEAPARVKVEIAEDRQAVTLTNPARVDDARAIVAALNDRESVRRGEAVKGVYVLTLAADLLGLDIRADADYHGSRATVTVHVEI